MSRAASAPARLNATLEPVRIGQVIVHEWVYGVRQWSEHDAGMQGAFAKIGYHERIVYRRNGSTEWEILDGRSASARMFRARAGKGRRR